MGYKLQPISCTNTLHTHSGVRTNLYRTLPSPHSSNSAISPNSHMLEILHSVHNLFIIDSQTVHILLLNRPEVRYRFFYRSQFVHTIHNLFIFYTQFASFSCIIKNSGFVHLVQLYRRRLCDITISLTFCAI